MLNLVLNGSFFATESIFIVPDKKKKNLPILIPVSVEMTANEEKIKMYDLMMSFPHWQASSRIL